MRAEASTPPAVVSSRTSSVAAAADRAKKYPSYGLPASRYSPSFPSPRLARPAVPVPAPEVMAIRWDDCPANGRAGSPAMVALARSAGLITGCHAYDDCPGLVRLGGASNDSPNTSCADHPLT